jgi:hypothetical protein
MKILRQNYKVLLLVFGEIITFAWTAFFLVLDLHSIAPKNTNWEFFALLGFFIFTILIGYHIFSLQKQLSPKLDMVFDNSPSCIHIYKVNDNTSTLYRIGLINLGGKTIENIKVSLEQLEPQNITFGPVKLLFMNQRLVNEEFNLHPGLKPALFVDVIQDGYINDPPEQVFILRYAIDNVPCVIKPGSYRLNLLAEGKDVPPCRKSFWVILAGEKIKFAQDQN